MAVRARPSAPATHYILHSPPCSLLLSTAEWPCGARPSAPAKHCFLHSSPSSLLWKPTAKWPSTAFYPLLPPPYFGSPLQSGHALLSTLFSLFSFFTKKAPLRIVVRDGAFLVKKKVRAALLSRALERTIIAAGGLNGRVRDGNGCLTPASGTNQRDWLRPSYPGNGAVRAMQHPCGPRTGPFGAAFPPPSMLPARALPTGGGIAGGRRPDLTAYQKRYGERLAALAHPPCQAGVLPAAFRDLRPGRLISGGAWRLDAFSAYPFATWLPGGADGSTTGTPEVARPRSSRTRGRSRQPSCACGG